MTADDCNSSRSDISVNSESCSSSGPGLDVSWDQVHIGGSIEQPIWDAALASADDALVLVQWLNSKIT